MAVTGSSANVIFPSDMNGSDSWDAAVPYPGPIAMPDTSNNILAELSLYTSAMSTPVPSDSVVSPASDDTDNGLFRTAASKQGMKRAFSSAEDDWNKRPKRENFITEPVTPCNRSKGSTYDLSKIPVPAPLSPACHSLCTDEADEILSMPPTPIPADISVLPTLSKEQTAKRRALRKAALKRNRSRKEEGQIAARAESGTKLEVELSQNGEPLDKKAARAIRNREAAMKSRVEAKQKMRKLQDENDGLCLKVKSLSDENNALTSQLKTLLHHALGVQVAKDQDVNQVFNAFTRMNSQNA